MPTVRTRIAPSPTGKMHIGTLRTALFDYFLARQNNGQFCIRIEDTDQERLVPGAVENLLEMFSVMGIPHDEGPVLNDDGTLSERGAYGPYTQSQRLPLYQQYAEQLIAHGHAYICFCTTERLDEMRKTQMAEKQTAKYDRRCLALTKNEVDARMATGEEYVVRMKVPEGKTEFDDAIRGRISFDNREVDDCILMKSDGYPSYYLACVVDDHLMEISHVLRGEEWISSTPKSLILYDMLQWESPIFAHVPLLLGPDKKKLSKRTGDTAVEEYVKHGYVAEAIVNFVGTLGFNPSGDTEIFTMQELIEKFDLSKVNSSGAILNVEKLDWMNKHYLAQMSEEDLVARVTPFLGDVVVDDVVRRALLVERSRVSRLTEFAEAIAPYIQDKAYDPAHLVWKKADVSDAKTQLTNVLGFLTGTSDEAFTQVSLLESVVKEYIRSEGLQNGNVLWPLRVAVSGMERSATPFECMWVVGKQTSLRRIRHAIDQLS